MIGFSLGRGVGLWAVAFKTRGSPCYVGFRAASRFDKGVLAKRVAVLVLPACWSSLERPGLAHFCSATLARASLVSQCRPLFVCLALRLADIASALGVRGQTRPGHGPSCKDEPLRKPFALRFL